MSTITVHWEGNMKFVGTDQNHFIIPMDAAPVYGGQEEGVRPMELLLISLGGCTGIEVGHILNKMRVKYDSLEVEVSGIRAENHPKVFNEINVLYKFSGENIPEDKIRKALQMAEQVYCSVANMINKAAKIHYTFEINEECGKET